VGRWEGILYRNGKRNSALEVFLNSMRYINPRLTYLLTVVVVGVGVLLSSSIRHACIFMSLAHVLL